MSKCKCVRGQAWFEAASIAEIAERGPVVPLSVVGEQGYIYASRLCFDCRGTGEVTSAPVLYARPGFAGLERIAASGRVGSHDQPSKQSLRDMPRHVLRGGGGCLCTVGSGHPAPSCRLCSGTGQVRDCWNGMAVLNPRASDLLSDWEFEPAVRAEPEPQSMAFEATVTSVVFNERLGTRGIYEVSICDGSHPHAPQQINLLPDDGISLPAVPSRVRVVLDLSGRGLPRVASLEVVDAHRWPCGGIHPTDRLVCPLPIRHGGDHAGKPKTPANAPVVTWPRGSLEAALLAARTPDPATTLPDRAVLGSLAGTKVRATFNTADLAAADGGAIEPGKLVVLKYQHPTIEEALRLSADAGVMVLPEGCEAQVIEPGESAQRHGWTIHNKTTGGHTITLAGPEADPVDAFRALLAACVLPAFVEAWKALTPHAEATVDPSRDWAVITLTLGPWRATARLYWQHPTDRRSLGERAARALGFAWLEASDAVARAWKPAVSR